MAGSATGEPATGARPTAGHARCPMAAPATAVPATVVPATAVPATAVSATLPPAAEIAPERPLSKRVLTVPAELAGRRVLDVLHALLPHEPTEALARALAEGALTVDRKRASDASLRLGAGARLVLHLSAPRAPAALVLGYSDADVVVADKPAGLPVQPTRQGGPCLEALASGMLGTAVALHRLDADASGLVLLARSARARAALQPALANHSLIRIYHAVCSGELSAPRTFEAPVAGKPARTHVTPLEHGVDATLVEARLATGRTHQIRVHLSSAGHPLLGDREHAPAAVAARAPRLCLHAVELAFPHPVTGAEVRVRSARPVELDRALRPAEDGAGAAATAPSRG